MENNRLLWVDWIKFIAIFGIIGIHVSSSLLNPDILFSLKWYQGVLAASVFRFGVILFIMVSGYLILRRQQTIYEIPKRVKRILLPFLFWLVIYCISKVFFQNQLGASWNFGDLLGLIFRGLLDPTLISVQFWYVYMILGLYILSPILSRWIQNAPIREIEYALWIWIIISILQFFNIHSLFIDYTRYFTGAVGYFIFGYYLTVKDDEIYKNRTFGIMLFLIGTAITFFGTVSFSSVSFDQSLFFIKLGDITPGACLQGIGLFIAIFNTDFSKFGENINWIVRKISDSSYGIYLSNILILKFLEKINLINLEGFTFLKIIISTFSVLIISAVLIEIMSKIPLLNIFSSKSSPDTFNIGGSVRKFIRRKNE